MDRSKIRIISAVLIAGAVLPVSAKKPKHYTNPVISVSAPDPTVIRDGKGTYYLYATENTRNLPIFKSDNLVDWKFVGTAFTEETRPQMVPDGMIWAPDIQKIGDKYVLYYSKSRWGGEWECGIGVATSDSPEGPFTDMGKMFISKEIGVQNSIDPFYIEDDGKKYLFWGSFRGIYGIELTEDGLRVKPGAAPVRIAGTLTEGTNILKHDGYYYLVGSAGSCCDEDRSTYHVVVARSKQLFGPYVDKDGRPALDNGFSLMHEGDDKVAGPRHNANFVTDDAGQQWMLYHGWDKADYEVGRKVYLDRIYWDENGWPRTASGHPTEKGERPVIRR